MNPADWALCEGLFAGDLPRGIGLEVSGTVDALGEGVTGVEAGDLVFGTAPFTGASEQALPDTWFPRPDARSGFADDSRNGLRGTERTRLRHLARAPPSGSPRHRSRSCAGRV
ncbi:alcohol dehydrogenase catalytic domain-containing protein [Amycolatopsis rubida]|uniref:alcohol dehydrogenase catalytic domain-containing protein n=1 Tax=Amycolatopsis rubida TaxID=112413 RepID=UPI000A5F616E|nr:hypothetical protein [Amycolatopsis rubida]